MSFWKFVSRSRVPIALVVIAIAGAGIYAACGSGEERVAQPQDQLLPGSSLPVLAVDIDIKPGGCPNPLSLGNNNVRKKKKVKRKKTGVSTVRVAILGSSSFDPKNVDVSTLSLYNASAAVRSQFGDVGGGCESNGPDGYEDLILFFDRSALVDALKFEGYGPGDLVLIGLAGQLLDGTNIAGSDDVTIVGGHIRKKTKK